MSTRTGDRGLGARLYTGVKSFNIIGRRKTWYGISSILILISMAALLFSGLTIGIEFKGGSSYTVNKSGISIEEARSTVEATGIPGEVIVQKIGDDKIRIQTGTLTTAQSNSVEDALVKAFNVQIENIDTQIIGPSWGEEITKKALYGLFGFLLVVIIFLAMTFEP
jgi:preprotein translocase subunit SecF